MAEARQTTGRNDATHESLSERFMVRSSGCTLSYSFTTANRDSEAGAPAMAGLSYKSATHVSFSSLPPAHVQPHRRENHCPLDDVLQRVVNAGLVQPLVQRADDDCTEQSTGDRSDAAGKARPADDRRCDRVELEALARPRFGRVELRRMDDPRQPGKCPACGIHREFVPGDADACKPGRFTVSSDRVKVLAEPRPVQQNARDGEDDAHEHDRHRQPPAQPARCRWPGSPRPRAGPEADGPR